MASERPDEISFPFFSLSPEVRNMVYSFALTSYPLRTRCTNTEKRWTRLGLVADWPKERPKPGLNLLLANHQTYHEASYILYRHGRFLIPAFVFNTLDDVLSTPRGATRPSRPVKTFSELATKAPHQHLTQIRNVEIEINWFRSARGMRPGRWLAHRLDSISQGLSVFPHLKNITVTWQSYSADPVRLEGVGLFGVWRSQRTLELLASFRKFQEEHPETVVMVETPSRGAVVTKNRTEPARARNLKVFMEMLEARAKMPVISQS